MQRRLAAPKQVARSAAALHLTVGTAVAGVTLTGLPSACAFPRADILLAEVTWVHIAGHVASWCRRNTAAF